MTYKEYRNESQKAFNELPIFYAFSNEQFERQMNERGLTINDTDKLYRFGDTGGFYLKTDSDKIHKCLEKYSTKNLRKMMESNHEFAKEAFEFEMFNHEYPINWQGDWDVCSCFGYVEYGEGKDAKDYLKELGFSDAIINIYTQALRTVYKESESW